MRHITLLIKHEKKWGKKTCEDYIFFFCLLCSIASTNGDNRENKAEVIGQTM